MSRNRLTRAPNMGTRYLLLVFLVLNPSSPAGPLGEFLPRVVLHPSILPPNLFRSNQLSVILVTSLEATFCFTFLVAGNFVPVFSHSAEGVCTYEFLSRKPGFLLSALHSHTFRWFSVTPLVFLFLGLLPLQLNEIWRIFCVMFGEEGRWTSFVCLQLYLTDMFEWLLSHSQIW